MNTKVRKIINPNLITDCHYEIAYGSEAHLDQLELWVNQVIGNNELQMVV
ncbi:hypothetical protein [Aureisphaera sp.]